MKKIWTEPVLEVLDVNMTMAGPGKAYADSTYEDCDEKGNLHYS
ncbi:paeninodin family lasso peptide [Falsibacillus albus]|uniref:Paeninodin family lasso peptide n=1 Tax=Falsibacillus albus TaxID=2478915 RepID=A0A3L7K6G2_9BACI|nr:paeninodin family lasso peptide [Falsibacillus albus]RLQ96292.1 paeninodin family lasso peptide [Falsibacillus albus]